jgi:hypothetical protein
MPIDVLSFAYAATVAAGGIVGYVKAGKISSKPVEEPSYEVGDGGFITMICYFVIHRRSVETKVIVGDCA